MQTLRIFILATLLCSAGIMQAQTSNTDQPVKKEEKKWYDKMKWSGYAQFRYNRLLETNRDFKSGSTDLSLGANQGFFFRRARLAYSGYVHDRVFAYVQLDYASIIRVKADASENWNFVQLRDAYFDYGFDAKNEYRLRVGLTKVPFGFDNMQSSAVRLPMDRSDAMNSGAPNERDMGAFFVWSPESVRKLQRDTLTQGGMKGHGDYGVFMIGVYNGQTANKPELNDQVHVAAKLSYPFRIGKQIIEPGVMAYSGRYVMAPDLLTTGVKTTVDKEYQDERVAVGLLVQPKPIGLAAEYTVGNSPVYSMALDSITTGKCQGGYATLSYRMAFKEAIVQPFFRAQYYQGGKKFEKDARNVHLNEYEGGIEFMVNKNFEVTTSYMLSHRRTSDKAAPTYDEKGNMLRIQLQYNY
jgi:hypothetical protein